MHPETLKAKQALQRAGIEWDEARVRMDVLLTMDEDGNRVRRYLDPRIVLDVPKDRALQHVHALVALGGLDVSITVTEDGTPSYPRVLVAERGTSRLVIREPRPGVGTSRSTVNDFDRVRVWAGGIEFPPTPEPPADDGERMPF